ncbi:hypothetical protein CCR85_12975 [Rhodothalassium salexigens]|uniref:photosynthetic reaction center cytochrome PufC n=1 Tax=Rhodothalassium salexigens TaxID=1086 RepID=UPI0019137632|nr:photosynthetic reaction center cytochrome PufC [Rhodothalassium salexigens]MBK5912398.1 hypothetical protein [Rhodothalassium salexigens]
MTRTVFNRRVAAAIAGVSVLVVAGCDDPADRPPLDADQIGFRGVGMEQVKNPRLEDIKRAMNEVPAPLYPPIEGDGPMASEVYENVQVLGDLTADQFTRLMAHITEWVVPKEGVPEDRQGCNYCHNPENLAEDWPYTKIVSRKMIQMTRDINSNWQDHVNQNGEGAGVTCYTCHRGNAVPQAVWFTAPEDPPTAVGWDNGQNHPTAAINYSSLPEDPFTEYLLEDNAARVLSGKALPNGNANNIMDTEHVYAMMIHISQGLGVNCTYCHNSRSVAEWSQSPPTRATAWYGIQMTRKVNNQWMAPLDSVIPTDSSDWIGGTKFGARLGPTGDVAKVNCTTCHQNVYKPLYGAKMLKDHPELWGDGDYSVEATSASAADAAAAGPSAQ